MSKTYRLFGYVHVFKKFLPFIYLLKKIGLISSFNIQINTNFKLKIKLNFIYFNKKPYFNRLFFFNKKSKHLYIKYKTLLWIYNLQPNYILILSTPYGWMTIKDCIKRQQGGFLYCSFNH